MPPAATTSPPSNKPLTGVFRYVTWNDVDSYERRGWQMASPLGEWSVLMWWCHNPDCTEHP